MLSDSSLGGCALSARGCNLLVGSRGPMMPCGVHKKKHTGKFQQPEALLEVLSDHSREAWEGEGAAKAVGAGEQPP